MFDKAFDSIGAAGAGRPNRTTRFPDLDDLDPAGPRKIRRRIRRRAGAVEEELSAKTRPWPRCRSSRPAGRAAQQVQQRADALARPRKNSSASWRGEKAERESKGARRQAGEGAESVRSEKDALARSATS